MLYWIYKEIAPLVGGGWYFHFTKKSDFFAFFARFFLFQVSFMTVGGSFDLQKREGVG